MTEALTQDVFDKLPNKFKCAAIDIDGRAFAYLCKAKQLKIDRYGQHKYKYGEYMYIGKGYDTTNWRESAIDREEPARPREYIKDTI